MQVFIQHLSILFLSLAPVAMLAQTSTSQKSVSEDGRYALNIDQSHHRVQAIDLRSNTIVRELKLQNKEGKLSLVSALYNNAKRQSFIVVLNDIAEIWELSYNPKAEPVYQGWVHDYQMGEGIADTQLFAPRKTQLELALDCFTFDASGNYAAGADQQGKLQIINLDIRRKITELQFAHPVYPCESKIENTETTSILHLKMKHTVPATMESDMSIILIDMKTGQRLTR
ncbi:MAG: hypothetical protein ACEQSE_03635 [Candidatus Aquirickettsiella gammari]